jgi:hypothetical protein
MQHIVEVAFDFNDKAITEYIEKNLEDDVRDECARRAYKKFVSTIPHSSYSVESDVQNFMVDAIYERFMEEHGTELVRLAALTLAKRTDRRKAWKEALAEAEAELSGKEDGNEQD